MNPDDPLAALAVIPGELRDTRAAVEDLHREVLTERHKRLRLTWNVTIAVAVLALAAIGLGVWVLHLESVDAALVRQNTDRAAAQAASSHDLCVKLNQTRMQIVGVWEKVLSGRPDGAVLLAQVKAAEPLGKCPAAGR